jgi:hypothetical protein
MVWTPTAAKGLPTDGIAFTECGVWTLILCKGPRTDSSVRQTSRTDTSRRSPRAARRGPDVARRSGPGYVAVVALRGGHLAASQLPQEVSTRLAHTVSVPQLTQQILGG